MERVARFLRLRNFSTRSLQALVSGLPLRALVPLAAAIILAMVGSYACFLWFMNGTAARYLRARAEIELARQIHQVLVPAVARTVGECEFVGFSVPSGDVGGDLVDVVTHGTDLVIDSLTA
jgi:serine phosphatase RsbU (regulator of sigma subunit)